MLFGRTAKVEDGSFVHCQGCRKTLFAVELESNLKVCPLCGHHHRLTWRERVEQIVDEGTFQELDGELRSHDPLEFPEYRDKHESAVARQQSHDSVVSGLGEIEGRRVALAVSDFHFMGGSMGSVAGEKITRTLERAAEKGIPAVIFCSSGGARMQEGILSLMQMPKTVGAVSRCRRAGVPFIAVFTDPTMAGVLASYASVADIIISEPKALIGFAGTRVSKQAQVSKVPDDFQTAAFALRSGMIDRVVERKDLKANLGRLIALLAPAREEAPVGR